MKKSGKGRVRSDRKRTQTDWSSATPRNKTATDLLKKQGLRSSTKTRSWPITPVKELGVPRAGNAKSNERTEMTYWNSSLMLGDAKASYAYENEGNWQII